MESSEEVKNDVESGAIRQVEITSIWNELSGCQLLAYGIGHFYNDLCASMWFSYLLLFMEKVMIMRSSLAGLLMLIGQVVDALSTAFFGVLGDSTSAPLCFRRCGQRKSWHTLGTALVTFSFAFIFNKCFACGQSRTDWELFVWYAPYVIVFQIGWAAVQISHLSLLPALTSNESSRTTMNSVRHGFTIVANLLVFAVLFVLFHFDDEGSAVGPLDIRHFSTISAMIIVLGLITEVIFYSVTKEPPKIDQVTVSAQSWYRPGIIRSFKISLLKWMHCLQFYQVGLLYVLCRLYFNISQVYFPLYIMHLPKLSKDYIALLPMVSYCSSFLVSSLTSLPFINRRCNLECLALFGCFCGISSCSMMHFDTYFPVHAMAALLGVSQSILLITSLSVVAQLISQDTGSGAFVYGTFSCMDKISSGIAFQMVELFSSFKVNESAVHHYTSFYRMVVVVVPTACLVIVLFVLLSLVVTKRGCPMCSRLSAQH